MNMTKALEARYTRDNVKAGEAQRKAQEIAFAPVIFQVSRVMLKSGVLKYLEENPDGVTMEEIAEHCALSPYAAKVLLEASLSIGTVIVKEDRFLLTKTGWFLLNDASTVADLDFNHDVN
ncbi:MAG: SAM-dependent methyltransferase, partial [Bacteroidales bacterium]|nr:SAM-dependent methyltransferase [Bacteroidales bacterium]